MDKEPTDTLLRYFRTGELIAIFPAVAGTSDPDTCMSYQTVGQHGSCDPSGLIRLTQPASLVSDSTKSFLAELERVGYKVNVVKRATAAHRKARVQQIGNR
jgi:hypothetical protein